MSKTSYPDVNPNPDFPKIEEKILDFWAKKKVFAQSVENRSGAKEFIFYDGPPFANGLPHYGHLLTGFVKDVFARYQTMRGKKVERRFGWDCHGLPAEMGSEKELGISGRQAIIKFGIDKFNEHCRTSVMKYTREWEEYVTRQARWVDFKGDYKTMDINFMESVLWAFKQLYDKGLVYEAYRVMPYSWAAETPLSNFETKLDNSYREREDKAITVAFELNTPPHGAPPADKYYVLAWTTTPWTLPSNLALAVGKEVQYGAVVKDNICYILAAKRVAAYEKELGTQVSDKTSIGHTHSISVDNLIGLSYHPLFPYFANHKHAFKILDGSSFVTDGDGTGIVHIAPGFGEDDQKVAEANGIELVVPVDGQGKYTDEIFDIPFPSPLVGEGQGGGAGSTHSTAELVESPPSQPSPTRGEGVLKLKGLNVIAEPGGSKFGLANDRIIDYLKATGQLIKQEQIKHNYPHCWRTDQPLIYRAMPSWYVEVTKFRDRAVELNKQINWIPEHIRDGQMGHMLATAPDWSISRNRFWGTPIPVWRSKSGKIKVFGSIKEIEDAWNSSSCGPQSGSTGSHAAGDPAQSLRASQDDKKKITDLHRPYIDDIIIHENGEEFRRVDDVFDCWFESGSMPFAQVHYPFENKDWFEHHFPADFITEYVGQTRGWFNTLIMLSTALFDKPPFKNCICHGVVLDAETGLKYSKRLKNYKDPLEVINQFGADALRWLMIASPVMRGHDLSVDPEGKFIRDVVRLAIKPIWNAYNFFCLYANADKMVASALCLVPSKNEPSSQGTHHEAHATNVMDRYILAKCKQAVESIEKSLDAYDTPTACDAVSQFFEALNNWYIRRNKERFWKTEQDADKQGAYDTLYTVLTVMCRAAAPLLPLTCEEIYKGLTGEGKSPLPLGEGKGEGFYHYQPEVLIKNARELRKNSTDAEKILWSILRDRQLDGYKFRRQHPIEKFVLDFYCDSAKLAIELDGGQHDAQKDYDEKRTKFLEQQGITVIRFWNNDVLENIEGVFETIYARLKELEPSPGASRHPLPEGEGSVSVHLAEFPDVSKFPDELSETIAMDIARDVCNAALAIRNKLNIRVRQPLSNLKFVSSLYVVSKDLQKIIEDEVNVKIVDFERDISVYATPKLSLNNQILGKRLPEKMKQIIPASKKGEWKQVDGVVEICGEKLLPSEYTLQLEPKPEYKDRAQALSTNDALVILDTTITPELEAEGIARDLVRMIQQARKDADLNVSDRIALSIEAPDAIAAAIKTHKNYIMEQTLAIDITNQPIENALFFAENPLDSATVKISLAKA